MGKWVIKAYNKEILEIIKKLKALAIEKGVYNLKDIFFAPLFDNKLGTYNFEDNYIVLSDTLLLDSFSNIKNVFLHELAHYIQFRYQGFSSHNKDFKEICKSLGVDDGFEKAKIKTKDKLKTQSKIKKLLALSSSPISAEAEAALKKAQMLILQSDLAAIDDNKIYEVTAYKGKTIPTTCKALVQMAKIISGGFAIITRVDDLKAYNFYGPLDIVESFTYLYDYFSYQVEKDYKNYIKENNLKSSTTLKNNYYSGVCAAIINRFNPSLDKECKSLILINKKIENSARSIMFPNQHIRKIHSSYRYDKSAYDEGKISGKKMKINKGIENRKEKSNLQLPLLK